MKKQILIPLVVLFTMFFSVNVFAQYPIASYDTPVHTGTYFAETHASNPSYSAEKRKMNVNVTDPGTSFGENKVVFMVYSLDFSQFKGPYTLETGESTSIDIDDSEWGLYVLFSKGRNLMTVTTEQEESSTN